MRFLGIDNGKTGSVALLSEEGPLLADTQIEADDTLNCDWFLTLLEGWEPDAAIIEYCFNNNPLVQMGGEFWAVCKLLSIPIQKVSVSKWKRALLGQNTNDKKVSIAKCCELYPTADLKRYSPVKQLPSQNADRAEALLLAHYLKITH